MARIAIIGARLAGLSCAHFLHRDHTVTVFSQNGYTGGAGATSGLDDTPLAFDRATSPRLVRLLQRLDVALKPLPFAFAVRDDLSGLEWSHASLGRLIARPKNLLDARFVRRLLTLRRFHRDALARLDEPETATQTLGEFVRTRGYDPDFFQSCLLPLASALWCMPPEPLLSFPAGLVLRGLRDHGLLRLTATRAWTTTEPGTAGCYARLSDSWRDRLRTEERATRIVRTSRGVTVMTDKGVAHAFDRVVVATPADQALRLLVNPTADEARLLGEFQYLRHPVALHTDVTVMPRTRRAWATASSRLSRDGEGRLQIATHRWLNPAPPAADAAARFLSVNTPDVDPARLLASTTVEQPLFTPATALAQSELPQLNVRARGRTETYFCGHYFGAGFLEDELQSAEQLARLLLERDPWEAGPEGFTPAMTATAAERAD